MVNSFQSVEQKTQKYARQLARILGRRTPQIKICFKPLLKTIAQADCEKNIIEYSSYHFFLLTPYVQNKVIAHEVCHIFYPNETHGPNWKKALNKLGYKADIYVENKDIQKKFLLLHEFLFNLK